MILNSIKKFHQQNGTGDGKDLNYNSSEMLKLRRKSQRPKNSYYFSRLQSILLSRTIQLTPFKPGVVK